VLILLSSAVYGHPENMNFLYSGDQTNISLVLFLSLIFSVFVGMLFTAYEFLLPKIKEVEE
jgi:hypothetical protein